VVRSAAALAALTLIPSGAASAPWAKLRRPLHLPTVAADKPCPVSGFARFDFAKYEVGRGIGPGPAYPIGFTQPGSILEFVYPPDPKSEFAGSAWSGQKVLWFVAPSYRGPVLIRGRRLDGPEILRFERGKVPPVELHIPRGTNVVGNPGVFEQGQRYRPSYTRLRAPGCYAYQIDGTSFSHVVVFRAALVS
jgi:hypothetical protein